MMGRQTMAGYVSVSQRLPCKEHIHAGDSAKSGRIGVAIIHSRVECPFRQEECEYTPARWGTQRERTAAVAVNRS